MTTRRNFLKLAIAAPVAGVMAKLGVLSLAVQTKAAAVASHVSGFYTGMWVVVAQGRGAGQTRQIVSYDGTTRTATLSADWKTKPDSGSEFSIVAGDKIGPSHQGMRFDA